MFVTTTELCNKLSIQLLQSKTLVESFLRYFNPDCTLHTAITHMILVLEQWSLTHDYSIGIHP